MKKVLVIGSSGAGKSVLSIKLGAITALPVIHLDFHHWRPGWTEPAKDVWHEQVAELLKGDEWIMDGNFGGTMERRLEICDTVVFLDMPRQICVWRIIKRVFKYRGDTRPELAPGCPERFDLAFLKWVWDFPKRSRPQVLDRIARVANRVSVFHLRSDREVEDFLDSIRRTYAGKENGRA